MKRVLHLVYCFDVMWVLLVYLYSHVCIYVQMVTLRKDPARTPTNWVNAPEFVPVRYTCKCAYTCTLYFMHECIVRVYCKKAFTLLWCSSFRKTVFLSLFYSVHLYTIYIHVQLIIKKLSYCNIHAMYCTRQHSESVKNKTNNFFILIPFKSEQVICTL